MVADIQVSIGWRSNWDYIYDVMCNEDFTLNDMWNIAALRIGYNDVYETEWKIVVRNSRENDHENLIYAGNISKSFHKWYNICFENMTTFNLLDIKTATLQRNVWMD